MAFYQILYWQDIASQVKAWDDFDEVKLDLGATERIDQSAQNQKLTSTDDYLAQWRWSDEKEREGTAQEVADVVREELAKLGS